MAKPVKRRTVKVRQACGLVAAQLRQMHARVTELVNARDLGSRTFTGVGTNSPLVLCKKIAE